MKTPRVLAAALSASLLFGALPGLALAQEADSEITPEGAEWTLTMLAGEPVPAEVTTTIFMSGGEVVGDAGCNSYFGSYMLEGESLTFPNPFGATQKLCDDAAMAVEDAYLPLLQETATWSIDEEGALGLADADGNVQLVYGEAPVDVTMSDVDALVATLGDLQAQIDEASAEVAAVAAETAAIPVNKFDKRVKSLEQDVKQLQNKTQGLNVDNLKKRIGALEETVNRLDKTVDRYRDRIKTLEVKERDHEQRIKALEEAANQPS